MANPDPVEIVKRQLWRNGLRVKDVHKTGLGFDLIVNEKHRVKVRTSRERQKSAAGGTILAIVDETEIKYLSCETGTCLPSNDSLLKLFA